MLQRTNCGNSRSIWYDKSSHASPQPTACCMLRIPSWKGYSLVNESICRAATLCLFHSIFTKAGSGFCCFKAMSNGNSPLDPPRSAAAFGCCSNKNLMTWMPCPLINATCKGRFELESFMAKESDNEGGDVDCAAWHSNDSSRCISGYIAFFSPTDSNLCKTLTKSDCHWLYQRPFRLRKVSRLYWCENSGHDRMKWSKKSRLQVLLEPTLASWNKVSTIWTLSKSKTGVPSCSCIADRETNRPNSPVSSSPGQGMRMASGWAFMMICMAVFFSWWIAKWIGRASKTNNLWKASLVGISNDSLQDADNMRRMFKGVPLCPKARCKGILPFGFLVQSVALSHWMSFLTISVDSVSWNSLYHRLPHATWMGRPSTGANTRVPRGYSRQSLWTSLTSLWRQALCRGIHPKVVGCLDRCRALRWFIVFFAFFPQLWHRDWQIQRFRTLSSIIISDRRARGVAILLRKRKFLELPWKSKKYSSSLSSSLSTRVAIFLSLLYLEMDGKSYTSSNYFSLSREGSLKSETSWRIQKNYF